MDQKVSLENIFRVVKMREPSGKSMFGMMVSMQEAEKMMERTKLVECGGLNVCPICEALRVR